MSASSLRVLGLLEEPMRTWESLTKTIGKLVIACRPEGDGNRAPSLLLKIKKTKNSTPRKELKTAASHHNSLAGVASVTSWGFVAFFVDTLISTWGFCG